MSTVRRESEAEDVCLVCCEPLKFVAVGLNCKHDVCCSLCSLRMRMLLKEERCVYCKSEEPKILVTRHGSDHINSFETWGDVAGPGYDFHEESGAFFDLNVDGGKEHMDTLLNLGSLSCDVCAAEPPPPPPPPKQGDGNSKPRRPRKPRKPTFPNFAAYQKHMSTKHGKFLCNICAEFRGQFVKELDVFTKAGLVEHNKNGDPATAFRGHPNCKFCKTLFYDEDHLYKHLHEKHENCHICARDPQRRNEYYKDYRNLERHFKKDHFLCTEKECLENKFVVFSNDIDLQAHIFSHHPHLAASMGGGSRNMLPVNFTIRRSGQAPLSADTTEPETIESFSFSFNPRQRQQEMLDIHRSNNQANLNMGERSFPSLGQSTAATTSISSAPSATPRSNYGSAVASSVQVADESAFPSLPNRKPMNKNARRRANRRTNQGIGYAAAGVQAPAPPQRGIQIQVKSKQGKRKKGKAPQQLETDTPKPVPGSDVSNAFVENVEQQIVDDDISQLERNVDEIQINESNTGAEPSSRQISAMAELTQVIKACLHGDEMRFQQFQMACGQYAVGQVDAHTYYATISSMFAKNQLNLFFPALINTLPSEELAQNLREVHEQTQSGKPIPADRQQKQSQRPATSPVQSQQNMSQGQSKPAVRAASAAHQTRQSFPSHQNASNQVQSNWPGLASQASASRTSQASASRTSQASASRTGQASASSSSASQATSNEPLQWRSDMAPWAKSTRAKPKPVSRPRVAQAPAVSSSNDFPSLSSVKPKAAAVSAPQSRATGSVQKRWDDWQKSSGGSKVFTLNKKKGNTKRL